MPIVFCGEKSHQVDEKNRIRIPSCFREMLGAKYVFVKGENEQIEVYSKDVADNKLLSLLDKLNEEVTDPDLQYAIMNYSASFTVANEDGQGRVVIPEELLKHAGIIKDVVTIGAIDHLVIMSAEKRLAGKETLSYSQSLKIIREKLKEKKNGI